jgi:hypothetical protein
MKILCASLLFTCFASPALALQGSDDCSTPTLIAGQGTFAYDNSLATTGTEGQSEALCYDFGTSAIDNDVWFEWTSDMDGTAVVTTCLGTSDDTKIAAYPGGTCPGSGTGGTALACNDDTCGLQSSIEFSVVNGSTYLVQLGNFPGSSANQAGTFQIIGDDPVLNPANGHYYDWVSLGTPLDWDSANLQAQASSHLGLGGHLLSVNDVPEHLFIVQTFGQEGWIGLFQDHNDPSYSEPGGGYIWSTGEPLGVFVPWSPGQPDDGNGNEDYAVLTNQGGWDDMALDGSMLVSGFYVEYEGTQTSVYCHGDGSGTPCPCGNSGNNGEGCANGGGSGGMLRSTGSTSVGTGDLVLTGDQLIANQPGLYFQGNNAINSGNGNPFGDGLRCAGGGVIRLQVRFASSSGSSQTSVNIPATGGIAAGDTKRFQLWYRDPNTSQCGASFNLSNGLEITFGS